ncbi:MAG: TonB family protein [Candidatus Acidiferrales bacterium]
MAPLTKDSVEVANPAADAAVPPVGIQTKSTSALRSDALSLEVAVKVHGSRVIEVARGTAPQTEPFEEQTVTMIVFPQGAVLRMSTHVNVSQMLVLTNIKTKQDSICRVLKVRPHSNQGSYVEVEFTHRQPGYWGVQFPSEGPVASNTVAPQQVNLESQARKPLASTSSLPAPAAQASRPSTPPTVTHDAKPAAAAPPPAPFVPAPRPESSFISIGSQETVQEAASATSTTKPLSPAERRVESPAPPVARNISAIDSHVVPSTAPPSLSMSELLGDDDPGSSSAVATIKASSAISPSRSEDKNEAATANASSQPTREVFGNFAGTASGASQSASSDAFGARLDSGLGMSAAEGAGAGQNWLLIAACVAVLVAGLGSGIVYFRQHPANSTSPSPHSASGLAQPVASNSSQLPAITPAGGPYSAGNADSNQPVQPNAVSAPPVAAPSNSATETKAPVTAANHPPASAKQTTSGVTPDMVSTALTARPTTSTRGDEGQADSAPVLDPSLVTSHANALPGITVSNAASLPSPEMRPEGPVKIGGDVRAPKLISSVMPQYPTAARSSGVQGDVVVETTIDKSGNVARMHVISGPSTLRAAAMDALRRWKYEPSRLDGEPVEVQMQVTIRFRI